MGIQHLERRSSFGGRRRRGLPGDELRKSPERPLDVFGMSFVFQPTTGLDTLYVAGWNGAFGSTLDPSSPPSRFPFFSRSARSPRCFSGAASWPAPGMASCGISFRRGTSAVAPSSRSSTPRQRMCWRQFRYRPSMPSSRAMPRSSGGGSVLGFFVGQIRSTRCRGTPASHRRLTTTASRSSAPGCRPAPRCKLSDQPPARGWRLRRPLAVLRAARP